MRTTVTLDREVAAAAEGMRQGSSMSLSEAINTLAKAGLLRGQRKPEPFRQRTVDVGLRVDITNIGETLDLLEGMDRR
jgi:hypothetical protein